jgi:Rrf2 family protein
MKFSAQEEYGIRCLLRIARQGAHECVTIPEISRKEGMTSAHVAKLLMLLRKEGFIRSTRGHTGGYALARPADSILVGEVLDALGGRLYDSNFCERHTGQQEVCTHSVSCSVRALWQEVQSAVDGVVNRITLQDLLELGSARNVQLHALRPRPGTVRSRRGA